MNLSEILLLIIAIQISNIFFMFVFFMLIGNNKKIKLNPVKAYQEHKKEEEEAKADELKEIQLLESLENIDNYNGTENGQKEITTNL